MKIRSFLIEGQTAITTYRKGFGVAGMNLIKVAVEKSSRHSEEYFGLLEVSSAELTRQRT